MTWVDRISVRAWGWILPGAIAVLAFVLRVIHVGRPNEVMFDETYYAKDAWGLLHFGYAQDTVENANTLIIKGDLDNIFTGEPTWIVHPDGGKWLIAIGEHFFGMTPFGWRIAAVVVGSLTVLVLARLVLRLTGSITLGCLAGFLLALDGLHLTLSRIALLDVFLAFWLVCAVACLAADRDWLGARLALDPHRWYAFRPWQLAAGISFGMALATKWSGLYVLAAFGLAIVGWELTARKVWTRRPNADTLRAVLRVGVPAFASLVLVAAAVYVISWTGFLVHHRVFEARFGHGYGDIKPWGDYVNNPTGGPFGGIIDAFASMWHFHVMTYDFHTGDYLAGKTHPYQANPWGWLVQHRPTSVATTTDVAAAKCGAAASSSCLSVVLVLGNPVIWWTGVLALIAALLRFMRNPTWRWSIPIVGLAATWLPWFTVGTRPIFTFYAVTILPFTIIAICLVLHSWWRWASRAEIQPEPTAGHRIDPTTTTIRPSRPILMPLLRNRRTVLFAAGVFVGAVIVAFVYVYPIWTGELLPYDDWHRRMWFTSWI